MLASVPAHLLWPSWLSKRASHRQEGGLGAMPAVSSDWAAGGAGRTPAPARPNPSLGLSQHSWGGGHVASDPPTTSQPGWQSAWPPAPPPASGCQAWKLLVSLPDPSPAEGLIQGTGLCGILASLNIYRVYVRALAILMRYMHCPLLPYVIKVSAEATAKPVLFLPLPSCFIIAFHVSAKSVLTCGNAKILFYSGSGSLTLMKISVITWIFKVWELVVLHSSVCKFWVRSSVCICHW